MQDASVLNSAINAPAFHSCSLKFSPKNERKILKAFLLGSLYKLFCELFHNKLDSNQNLVVECHIMDSRIIQLLIQGIIETEEYTLEGIAYYTHIPFDIVYDAACGINNQFSVTAWAKIVELYIQVKPDTTQVLVDKLLEIKSKNHIALQSLLTE